MKKIFIFLFIFEYIESSIISNIDRNITITYKDYSLSVLTYPCKGKSTGDVCGGLILDNPNINDKTQWQIKKDQFNKYCLITYDPLFKYIYQIVYTNDNLQLCHLSPYSCTRAKAMITGYDFEDCVQDNVKWNNSTNKIHFEFRDKFIEPIILNDKNLDIESFIILSDNKEYYDVSPFDCDEGQIKTLEGLCLEQYSLNDNDLFYLLEEGKDLILSLHVEKFQGFLRNNKYKSIVIW
jgi:hypothetical protein